MFTRKQSNFNSNEEEDDLILTDLVAKNAPSANKIENRLFSNKNIVIIPDEFSRNKRNIIKNGGLAAGAAEPVDGVRSRNAVIPTFNISETNLTNDVIKEDED